MTTSTLSKNMFVQPKPEMRGNTMTATAAAPQTGWLEHRLPELFKFDKIGKQLTGVLVGIDSVVLDGKDVTEFRFATPEHPELQVKVRATYQLGQLILPSHKGRTFEIKYVGDDESANGMKLFQVRSRAGRKQNSALEITDDDLPNF